MMKYLGAPFLLLASLWARLTQPRQMNRQGLLDSCPVDKGPCPHANGGECRARTIEDQASCRLNTQKWRRR